MGEHLSGGHTAVEDRKDVISSDPENRPMTDARSAELDRQIEAGLDRQRAQDPQERVGAQTDRVGDAAAIDLTRWQAWRDSDAGKAYMAAHKAQIHATLEAGRAQRKAAEADHTTDISTTIEKPMHEPATPEAPDEVSLKSSDTPLKPNPVPESSPRATTTPIEAGASKGRASNIGEALSRAANMSEDVSTRIRGWEKAYNAGGKEALGKQLLREVAVIAIEAAIKSTNKDIQTIGKVAKFLMPRLDRSRADKRGVSNAKAEAETRQRRRHAKHESQKASNNSEANTFDNDYEGHERSEGDTHDGYDIYDGAESLVASVKEATTRARSGRHRKASRHQMVVRNFKERLNRAKDSAKDWAFSTNVGRAASATAAAYSAGRESWKNTRK